VSANAGVSLETLLRSVLPSGLCLPVLPGTRFVTLGGAVAADIHGKNHHADGSLSRWLDEIELIDGCGELRRLSPSDDPAAFWATTGGMGLTGITLSATVQLTPVESSYMRVRTRRFASIDDAFAAMRESPDRYHVAWVDAAARGGRLGRAVLDEGDHAVRDDLPRGLRNAPLRYRPRQFVSAPRLPMNVLSPALVRRFNSVWWHRAADDATRLASVTSFFHPLDGVGSWNNLYGRAGFVQYQFVVPFGAEDVVLETLRLLSAGDAPPYLVVLKRFGAESLGPLSFPMPGWTLAADIPADRPGLAGMLDALDECVAGVGGRVYLAKDARMRPELLTAMYPRLSEWKETRQRLDPDRRFWSDLGRRLHLC
jgi:decaprenylphospho-beta-D-ribofuranose 2-oxidase